jgi:chromosome segregation ATPase
MAGNFHPALSLLGTFAESGQLTGPSHDALAFRFSKLHTAFVRSCENESSLMRWSRALHQELKSQKATIAASAQHESDHRSEIANLRHTIANIDAQLDFTQQQIAATKSSTSTKEHEEEKLREKLRESENFAKSNMSPNILELQAEIKNLQESIAQRKVTLGKLADEGKGLKDRLANREAQLSEIKAKKGQTARRLAEVASYPVKIQGKSSTVASALAQLKSEEKAALEKLQKVELAIETETARYRSMEQEYESQIEEINSISDDISAKRKIFDQFTERVKEKVNEKLEQEKQLRKLEHSIRDQELFVKTANQQLSQINRETEKRKVATLKMEDTISRLALDKQTLEQRDNKLQKELRDERHRNSKLQAELDRTIRSKENALKALLAAEGAAEQTLTNIKAALSERDQNQVVMNCLENRKQELLQQLEESSTIRNRKAREVVAFSNKLRDVKSLIVQQNLTLKDCVRQFEAANNRIFECSKMYEKVRMDRNRFLGIIQTSRQLIVELTERIRLLEAAVGVLQHEYQEVATAVKSQKVQLSAAFDRRERTKGELKDAEGRYEQLQKKVAQQADEVGRMNRLLEQLEDTIELQQRRYSMQADECANVQRSLLDRQDELCLVHEQYTRHTEVVKRGEIALRRREEELRLLNHQLNDFVRKMEILQKRIPQIRQCDIEIEELQRQIDRERRDLDALTAKLEVPSKNERRRQYVGRNYTGEQLDEKIRIYENQLSAKTTMRYEKMILLREIEEKVAEMRAHISPRPSPRAVRSSQIATRRKKMAALSEMAMYQAQGDELGEQKEVVKQQLQDAEERASRGEAFDEQAQKMLAMHERDIRNSARRKREVDGDDDEEDGSPGRQKFDAYPTVDGLSRPYGAFPVFQPAAPAPNLRHYRKEPPRRIVV